MVVGNPIFRCPPVSFKCLSFTLFMIHGMAWTNATAVHLGMAWTNATAVHLGMAWIASLEI
jgi:hypothetical protein